MKSGIIIYRKEDYNKSSFFCDELIRYGNQFNLKIELYFFEDIQLCIDNNSFYLKYKNNKIQHVDFVINRSRERYLSLHLHKMNIKTFNTYDVVMMCNDKALTHQHINALSINSIKTTIQPVYSFNEDNYTSFPYVLKSLDSHGGKEVYLINNSSEFSSSLDLINKDYVLIQSLCNNPGVDVRVYILGNKIYHSILRENPNDFKSNYTLGGTCSLYTLNEKQKSIINKVLEQYYFDFVGIDFIFDKEGNMLFNEIEDVVGCRTLYENNKDVAYDYMQYINHYINKKGI